MTQSIGALHLYIDGQWLNGEGRSLQSVINPATGEVVGELPLANGADLDLALESSERAFSSWRKTSAWERGNILKKTAQFLRERVDAIARLLTLEEGKTLAESRGEVFIAADIFEWHAEEAKRVCGRLLPSRVSGQRQLVMKEPVGPVAAFSPWNFPAVTPARKIAASLAAGCSCILKPAEETPATALAIARALADAGLPKGVLNVVFGVPNQVSEHLLSSPVIRKLSFTGSTVVGKLLARRAADGVIRSTLELGGHAPVLIFGDADLEKAIEQSTLWKFRNAGQVCTSPTRFYVEDSVFDAFVSGFAARAGAIAVGNGLDPASMMGPLANARRLGSIEAHIHDAIQRGAVLRCGGERLGNHGLFWAPTIIANVPDSARIMEEEPFGAVAIVNRFRGLDEAITFANRLPFGLAAYAFTTSARNATMLGDEIEAGMIGINSFAVTAPESPFGGHKQSGYGSEGGTEGMESYLKTKFVNHIHI